MEAALSLPAHLISRSHFSWLSGQVLIIFELNRKNKIVPSPELLIWVHPVD